MNPAVDTCRISPVRWGALILFIALLLYSAPIASSYVYAGQSIAIEGDFNASEFSCSGSSPNGQILRNDANCVFDGEKLFTTFICRFEATISDVIGHVYCGVSDSIGTPMRAVLTLTIAFLGIGFLLGSVPFTAKDLAIFFLKISFVWAFATNAELAIGFAYQGLVTFAKEGITIVLANVAGNPSASGGDGFVYIDDMFNRVLQGESGSGAQTEGGEKVCQFSVLAILLVMVIGVPPIALIGLYAVFKLAYVFIRAIIGYMFAILAITFMISLSPFFLAFALFNATRSLFDKYTSYLLSFAIQMIVVFAFLGLVLSLDMFDYLSGFLNLIRPVGDIPSGAGFMVNVAQCGICEFEVVGGSGASLGTPQCTGETRSFLDMMSSSDFIVQASKEMVKLVIIAMILDSLMQLIPSLARYLGGERLASNLAGISPGSGQNLNIPGERLLTGAGTSFAAAYRTSGGNPVQGFKQALGDTLIGRRNNSGGWARDESGNEMRGLLGNAVNFIGSLGTR